MNVYWLFFHLVNQLTMVGAVPFPGKHVTSANSKTAFSVVSYKENLIHN